MTYTARLKKSTCLIIYFCIVSFFISAQSSLLEAENSESQDTNVNSTVSSEDNNGQVRKEEKAPLPNGFGLIELGMDLGKVKELLKEDSYFAYRGDPDVSFIPREKQRLIECAGYSFISRGLFQFYEKKLYIISLELNQDRIDFFTMYRTLKGKYGNSGSLSPSKITWSNENIQLSLERPLTVKYIDISVFNKLKKRGKAGEDRQKQSMEEFLDEF